MAVTFVIIIFVSEKRFQTIQQEFKEKYYHHFTDEEENKLIYMDIFKEYVSCSNALIPGRSPIAGLHCYAIQK